MSNIIAAAEDSKKLSKRAHFTETKKGDITYRITGKNKKGKAPKYELYRVEDGKLKSIKLPEKSMLRGAIIAYISKLHPKCKLSSRIVAPDTKKTDKKVKERYFEVVVRC